MSVSAAPGTGAATLNAALIGYQTFAAAGVSNGQVISYLIEDGSNWEVGQGTYSTTGPSLARTTVQGSSNGGAAITASSAAVVSIVALASDLTTPFVSVAFAASLTLDFNNRNYEVGPLTANLTLNNPINLSAGQSGMITLPQDSTGGRTITVGSFWKFPGGAPTLSTAASAVDAIAYEVRSASYIFATLLKAFA